jgi:hypothetical protein
LIFSIGTTFSCATGLQPFPATFIYEYDPVTPICAQYRITSLEKLTYEWVQDIQIDQCPAIFGFSAEDTPKVLRWGVKAIKKSK